MRVLLVNPHRDYDRYVPAWLRDYCRFTAAVENLEEVWLPVEMAYLAAILRARVEVDFVDAHAERRRMTARDFEGYDAVIACTAPYEKWRCTQIFTGHATDLLREASSAGARTVIYGPHVTVDPEAFQGIDAVIAGEPEPVIEEAVGSERRGVFGPRPIGSLDLMPEPDYSIFSPARYSANVLFEGRVRGPFAVVTGSRGCPYPCTVCFKAMVPRVMVKHSPAVVERIVTRLVREQGYRAVAFADLTFTLDRKWTLGVCRRLEGLRVPYYASTRVDCLDEEIVSALASSGCAKIELGVETVSDENLSRLKKKVTWEAVERAVVLCRRAGIPIVSTFRMVFVPGETRETLAEVERVCRRLEIDIFPNVCTPYPATPLWEDGVKEGKIRPGKPNWEDVVLSAGTIGTGFGREEVIRLCEGMAWRSHRPYFRSLRNYYRTFGAGRLISKVGSTVVDRLAGPRGEGPARRYRHVLGRTYILVRLRTLLPAALLDALGYPAARLARIVRARRRLPEPGSVRKVLAVRLDHIGDVLMTTPALRALKGLYPQARVTCLVGPWAASILESNPNVDEIVESASPWFQGLETTRFHPGSFLRLARRLRRERFDLCLDFRGDPRHLLLGRLGGAACVAGYGIRGGGFLADRLPPYREDIHEVERNLDVIRHLGGKPGEERLEIFLTAEEEKRAGELLAGLGIAGRRFLVALCPYSRNRTRWWKDERFGEIARWLARELGAQVVLFSDAEHRERIERIREAAGPGVHSLAGRTTLREFAACLKRMDLIVSIESSPVHFASALGVPIVLLFSGTGLSEHWGPYRVPCRIVRSRAVCAPCFRISCPKDTVECMDGIQVEDVARAVLSLLREVPGRKA